MNVSAVRFTTASPSDVRTGLLGWVSFVLSGALLVDGVTLRRTRDGRLQLSYPARRDRAGNDHPYLRPVNDGARRLLEAEVLGALGLDHRREEQA